MQGLTHGLGVLLYMYDVRGRGWKGGGVRLIDWRGVGDRLNGYGQWTDGCVEGGTMVYGVMEKELMNASVWVVVVDS